MWHAGYFAVSFSSLPTQKKGEGWGCRRWWISNSCLSHQQNATKSTTWGSLLHGSYRIPLPPSSREAFGEHSRREATWSSVHYNSQLCVPNIIAVAPSSFLGTEELRLTASVLSSDAYVTTKAEVLQGNTQLTRNKTNAYSFIQQGVATFGQKRFWRTGSVWIGTPLHLK